ncbi:hypothetical protein [Microbispora rosea]|uniref:hypothetical protein n=1 Tax=Microbispora rosea TaxID=58117 RepID=UPI0012DC773C|nr:hypothetical protein [Microbispora rosea]
MGGAMASGQLLSFLTEGKPAQRTGDPIVPDGLLPSYRYVDPGGAQEARPERRHS